MVLFVTVLYCTLSLSLSICTYMYHTCYFVFICSPIEKHFSCFVRHFLWRHTKGTYQRHNPYKVSVVATLGHLQHEAGPWGEETMRERERDREREIESWDAKSRQSHTHTHTHIRMQAYASTAFESLEHAEYKMLHRTLRSDDPFGLAI